ncbi:hypothetical protein [Enterococcus mundtii]|nr:hypothetical protein [Enterococcus mundtii]
MLTNRTKRLFGLLLAPALLALAIVLFIPLLDRGVLLTHKLEWQYSR